MRTQRIFRYLVLSVLAVLLSVQGASAQTTITIDQARNEPLGTEVTIEGTVTRAFGAYLRMQDDSGPTGASAVVLRQTFGDLSDDFQAAIADGTIAQGTQLRVTGSTSEFNGLVQINNEDLVSYQVQGQGTAPAPQSVTIDDLTLNGEDYESELVSISGITFPSASGTFSFRQTYQVTDGTASTDLRVQADDETQLGGSPIPNVPIDYEGVIGQFNSTYQLTPVLSSDVPVPFFELSRAYADAEEGGAAVSVNIRAVNIPDGETGTVSASIRTESTAEIGPDVTGIQDAAQFEFTGPTPTPRTITFDAVDDTDREGLERLEIQFSSPDILKGEARFTLWIRDDATAQGPIAEGQSGLALRETLRDTYGGAPTLEYESPGPARDTLFAAVYGASGDSLRGVYTGFARFLPEDADPTVAACNFDTQTCFDANDINTEHAWPQSLGAGQMPAQGDMHILFPARGDVNSARSNFPFADIADAETEQWFLQDLTRSDPPSQPALWSGVDEAASSLESRFEPRDEVKGDIARAMFYFVTMYPERADLQFYEVQRQTLYQWHQDDPADAAEVRRNIFKASYQGNKVNPFIVDPTLVARAYFGPVGPPSGIVAAPGNESVQLRWTEPLNGTPAGYNVYRSTSSFDATGQAQRVNTGGLITATSFTDDDVQLGGSYVYRITSVDANGNESALSESEDALLYPNAFDVSVDRPFGDVAESSSYRLVALPGDADVPVDDNLGDPDTGWTALWDDGSDTNFLVRFDGSDTFRFRPGRGFWLLSESNWTVDTSIPSVPLTNESVTIPLHEGWNIISNPLPVDLSWADVSAANGGGLQPVWSFGGSFEESATFRTARSGDAFYFLNDGGLSELTLPLSAAALDGTAAVKSSRSVPDAQTVTLTATSAAQSARIVVGHHPDAADGRDRYDVVAPPSAFTETALRVRTDASAPRQQHLTRDLRAAAAQGHAYTVVLTAPAGEPVTLSTDLAASRPDAHAVLVHAATGQRHDLAGGTVTFRPAAETSTWQLRLGSKAFVQAPTDQEAQGIVVQKPAPNPFRESTTVRYTLPEATDVRVQVFDLLGRRVATLTDERQTSGTHTLRWQGTNAGGAPIASGMYFIRMTIGDQRIVHKVVHVR